MPGWTSWTWTDAGSLQQHSSWRPQCNQGWKTVWHPCVRCLILCRRAHACQGVCMTSSHLGPGAPLNAAGAQLDSWCSCSKHHSMAAPGASLCAYVGRRQLLQDAPCQQGDPLCQATPIGTTGLGHMQPGWPQCGSIHPVAGSMHSCQQPCHPLWASKQCYVAVPRRRPARPQLSTATPAVWHVWVVSVIRHAG